MKKEQLIEALKLMPTNPIGCYFFKATQHGLGLVEEAKKIAKEVWNQKFVYINTALADVDDMQLQLKLEQAKEMEPTTYCFDEMDKANKEMRSFIFNNLAINREKFIHPNSHIIYIVNPDDNEYYQDPWDDYVTLHSTVFNVEA